MMPACRLIVAAAAAFTTLAAASPCCTTTPILASCFGFAPDGPNSASLQMAVNSCNNASFTIDVAPGSNGVWFLEGLPPHAAGAGPWRDAGSAGVTLNASGQTVTLAPGVSLRAAPGFYAGAHDVLVAIRGEGISLLGTRGSLLAMQRLAYANASLYNHSEWRHAIAIDDSRGVALRRLRIEDTGGDGVDITGTTADVSLVDVVTDRAFRNGVSVTGVDGLLIANSSFLNSAGTPPMAGIDLEPASPKMKVNNVTVRNVTFAGNQQIQVSLSLYEQINVTDNVLFENVTISDGPMTALMLFSFKTNGPLGSMVFRDIVITNVGGAGILFERNGSAGAAVEFTNVVLRDTATAWYSSYGHWPLDISGGGVVLNNVTVFDSRPRPFLYGGWYAGSTGGIRGTVTVVTNVSAATYPACAPYYFNASGGANSLQVDCRAPAPEAPPARAPLLVLPPPRGGRNAAPYGDPATGCLPGETPLSVPGIPGAFCSPSCAAQGDEAVNLCPPAPNGTVHVEGKCNIATDKDWKPSACGLVCDRTVYSPKWAPTVCPPGSTCQLAQGYGLCTYPSSTTAGGAAAAAAAAASPCCAASPILASCFGYAPGGNNSGFLRAALDACASSFTVDFVPGSDGVWDLEGLDIDLGARSVIKAGLALNVSNVRMTLAAGVTLRAARGAYTGLHDVLVLMGAVNASNISLVGAGDNELLMWQGDYADAALYAHSEWRHGVMVWHGANVELRGVRVADTGGDGVDICCNSTNVVVAGVVTQRAFRNGMSVTGVTNLTVEDSQFLDTNGTCCESGLDVEPEVPSEQALGIVFRNCTFAGNAMNQVTLSLYGLASNVVDLAFEGCTVGPSGSKNLGGVTISGLANETRGTIAFRDTLIQRTGEPGIAIDHRAENTTLVFENTVLNGTAFVEHWPVQIHGGTVRLVNTTVYDPFRRSTWLMAPEQRPGKPFDPAFDISGSATVFKNPAASCEPSWPNSINCSMAILGCANVTA